MLPTGTVRSRSVLLARNTSCSPPKIANGSTPSVSAVALVRSGPHTASSMDSRPGWMSFPHQNDTARRLKASSLIPLTTDLARPISAALFVSHRSEAESRKSWLRPNRT